MGIQEIQEIGKIVAATSGSAKEVFILYLAKGVLEIVIWVSLLGVVIVSAYKLIKRAMDQNATMNTIARAYDGTEWLTPRQSEDIAKIIREYREAKRG